VCSIVILSSSDLLSRRALLYVFAVFAGIWQLLTVPTNNLDILIRAAPYISIRLFSSLLST
jgi:hypothetical protein